MSDLMWLVDYLKGTLTLLGIPGWLLVILAFALRVSSIVGGIQRLLNWIRTAQKWATHSRAATPLMFLTGLGLIISAGYSSAKLRAQQAAPLQTLYRAIDGTAYQVIAVDQNTLGTIPGADGLRVLTIAGSDDGLTPHNTDWAVQGRAFTAACVGVLQGLQVLHPYEQVWRTRVLHPNSLRQTFAAGGGGRLVLGDDTDALEVCKDRSNCSGDLEDADIYRLDHANRGGGAIRSACICNGLLVPGAHTDLLNAFAFGLPHADVPPTCTAVPQALQWSVCGEIPSDGFTLTEGDVVVFIYNHSLEALPMSVGMAGVLVDLDGQNELHCPARSVLASKHAIEFKAARPGPH